MERSITGKLSSIESPSLKSLMLTLSFSSSPFPSPSSESSPFMVDYLVRSFGCSRERAISASKHLLHIKSPEKPDSVLAFLRRIGLSESQLSSAVLRRPAILASNVESNIIPKVKLFESLGASGKELAGLVASSTACFGNSVERRIIPSINFLRDLLQDDKKVRNALKRCPWILTNDSGKTLSRNVEFLREKGLDLSWIASLVHKSPIVLVLKLDQLEIACKTVEELGISPSVSGFVDALHVATSISKENLVKKLSFLRSYGFEESHIHVLFRWSPSVFKFSEKSLKRKLDFFLNIVGYDHQLLLKCPLQIGLSLEGRLIPRHRWIQNLKSKGLVSEEVNFGKAFLLTDEKFVNEYVHKFSDGDGSDLLEAYKEFAEGTNDSSSEDSDSREV